MRHVLGLYHGRPGARAWRRTLSDAGRLAGADERLLRDALDAVEGAAVAAVQPAEEGGVKGGVIHIELKSVNSRYLDCLFRVSDELRLIEPALRELIGSRITRGKLECRVSFASGAGGGQSATNLLSR